MSSKDEHEGNVSRTPSDDLGAAVARTEALLRIGLRRQIENAIPPSWTKGRRRKILDFCVEARTRNAIREHVGSIAGYEMQDYLDEAVHLGLLARSLRGRVEHFEAVVHAVVPARSSRRPRGKKGTVRK